MIANQAVNSEASAIRQPHFVEHAESAAKEWCGMLAREATSSLCAARFSELAKGADLRRERPQSYDRTDLARCRKRVGNSSARVDTFFLEINFDQPTKLQKANGAKTVPT